MLRLKLWVRLLGTPEGSRVCVLVCEILINAVVDLYISCIHDQITVCWRCLECECNQPVSWMRLLVQKSPVIFVKCFSISVHRWKPRCNVSFSDNAHFFCAKAVFRRHTNISGDTFWKSRIISGYRESVDTQTPIITFRN